MGATLQVLRKDLRRLWPLVLLWNAWAGFYTLRFLAEATQPQAWQHPSVAWTWLVFAGSGLVGALSTFVSLAVFVSLLLRDDPPWTLRAQWFTRPVSSLQLLGAKTIFLTLFVILLPTMLHLGVFLSQGLPFEDLPRAGFFLAAQLIAWCLLVVATLALVPRPAGQALALLVVVPLLMQVLVPILFRFGAWRRELSPVLTSAVDSQLVVWGLGLASLGFLLATGRWNGPWRSRRAWRPAISALAILLLVLALAPLLVWGTARQEDGLRLGVVDQRPVDVAEVPSFGSNGIFLHLNLVIEPTKAPPAATLWRIDALDVAVVDTSGAPVLQEANLPTIDFRDQQAVLDALGGATAKGQLRSSSFMETREEDPTRPSFLLAVDPDTFFSLAQTETRLMGSAMARRDTLSRLGEIPLTAGSELRQGLDWFRILSVSPSSGRNGVSDPPSTFEVKFAARRLAWEPDNRACGLVLVVHDPKENTAVEAFWVNQHLRIETVLGTPAFRTSVSSLQVDDAWLRNGFRLAILERCPGSYLRVPFSADHFRMIDYTRGAQRKREELEQARAAEEVAEAADAS